MSADAEPPAPWQPRSILDGIDLDAPPPEPSLLGLAYPGKMLLLSGAPEAAKTWVALAIVAEAIRQNGTALFVDTDGTGQRDLAARLLALGLEREALGAVGYCDDARELFGTEDARTAVTAWIVAKVQRGPVVVVIDSANPTTTALGHKLDEAGFTAVEAAVIAPVKRAGGTPVVIDHIAIHAAKDSPYSISSQRKHAASDIHLRLTSVGQALMRSGPAASFVITGPKDRPGGVERRGKSRHVGKVTFTPGPEGAVGVEVDLSPPSAQEARAIFRPTVLMERVSKWGALQPGAFSKRDVESDVHGKGEALRAAVDVLLAEGYLEADGNRYRHLQPYREGDDPEASQEADLSGTHSRGASLGASPGSGASTGRQGASPRPARNHAGSEGASHPQGRARPESVGGGASPASPPIGRDEGRTTGERPEQVELEDWRAMLPDHGEKAAGSNHASLPGLTPRGVEDDARGVGA